MIKMIALESSKKEFLLITLFLVVNVFLYIFSVENATFVEGADASQYYGPAVSLLQHGEFRAGVDGDFLTFGTPLYSILLAIPIAIFGIDQSSFSIVFIQCLFLYTTGIITRKFSVVFLKKESFLLHSFIIFNPNSLVTAHLVQSETLFTLLLVLSIYFLFKLVNRNSFKYVFLLGLVLGLLTLTRPAGLYLIYIFPIIFLISFYVNDRMEFWRHFRQNIIKAIVVLLVSAFVVSPWYVRNYSLFGEMFLSSNSGAYLKDQYIQLLKISNNFSEEEAIDRIDNEIHNHYKKNQVNKLCFKNQRHWSCNKYLSKAMINGIIHEPSSHHARALLESWSYLYFSGGASNYRNYLGMSGKEKIVSFQKERYSGLDGIINFVRSIDLPYLTILLLTTGFSFVTRIAGMVGFIFLLKNREVWPYMVAIVGVIILFTAMYLYLGQSRFRVPLEPFLMIFAVIGVYNFPIKIMNKFKK
mgnify:CR=1|jgi:4-amino-4-deoxy-L-arabinose transferase-like glycosyltransferase